MVVFMIEVAGNARVFHGGNAVEAVQAALRALPAVVCRNGTFWSRLDLDPTDSKARALLDEALRGL